MGGAGSPSARRSSARGRSRPGSPRARLFVALDLPSQARRDLAAWRDGAIAGREDLRPVSVDALHVTLAFLGYRPEREIPGIAETAFVAVRALRPPRVRAGAVRPIPPRRPRLFALDLEDEGDRASVVQAAVADALAAARYYRPEARPFWVHVTFARVKRGRRADPLEAPAPPGGGFEAVEVTLYRSTLRPQGALYEPLAQTRLGQGG